MASGNKYDSEYNLLNADYTTAPTIITLGNTSSRTAALGTGNYKLWSPDSDPIFIQGGSTIKALSGAAYGILAGMVINFKVTNASNAYVAGCVVSGTGTSGTIYIAKL